MDQEESTQAELGEELDTIKSPPTPIEQEKYDLRPFFTLALNLLCITDFDGYFKQLNPMWTTRLGWTVEELMSKPFLDFVHPDDREATQAEFDRLINGEDSICFENRYLHQNGSYRWLRWSSWRTSAAQLLYAIAYDFTRQNRQEREIIEIADREKERLGLELHDGLCQSLAGIAALSSALSRRLAAHAGTTESAAAAEISQLLNEAIHQARDLAHGLSPIGLNIVGLQGALETLSFNTEQWFNITCTLTYDCSFPRLHHEVEGHLFRIAQEAVNNAVKHGQTERVEISLCINDKKGMMIIRDNGEGMSENPGDSNGIGLHTMFYRTRLIGGSLKVRQHKPRGMAVICVFPLTETYELLEDMDDAYNDTRTRPPG